MVPARPPTHSLARHGAPVYDSVPRLLWLRPKRIVMKRVWILRDGNQIGAMIGPDLVRGIGGFGDSVSLAVADLASQFESHGYGLSEGSVGVECRGRVIHAAVTRGAVDALRSLARMLDGYSEDDFPALDWFQIGINLHSSLYPGR